MSLIACLQEEQDPRRSQGQRYGHVAMLLPIITGILTSTVIAKPVVFAGTAGRIRQTGSASKTGKFRRM